MKASLLRHLVFLLIASPLMVAPASALAGTWNSNPANGDWSMPSNWSSNASPNGPADIATFGLSTITSVFLSANTEVDRIAFDAGASGYTITAAAATTLTLSGTGIVNQSGITQNFVAGVDASRRFGTIAFRQNANAGSGTNFTASGTIVQAQTLNDHGGVILFYNQANASSSVISVNGGAVTGANGGSLSFYNSASAGSAVIATRGSGMLDSLAGSTTFYDTASAGNATFVNAGTTQDATPTFDPWGQAIPYFVQGGQMTFRNSSTAGQANFINNGGTAAYATGGRMLFRDSSSAESATMINNGGAGRSASGGFTRFTDSSSAGNASIISNGAATGDAYGGGVSFQSNSSAGNSILIANDGPSVIQAGEIDFSQNSQGGTARVQVFGNGHMNIGAHGGGLTIGSLEGTGIVFLGSNALAVGNSNQSTVFSGAMQDGAPPGSVGGAGGGLTKIGAGTLTMTGSNTYTGATTVNAGTLILDGSIMSVVGVNGGILAGAGMSRALTVNTGGTLSPGTGNSPGILSVLGNLKLSLGSTYLVDLNGSAVGTQHDQTSVTGAITFEDAILSLRIGGPLLPSGQFTILNNDGTDAVIGRFSGLVEGASFMAANQTFTISYQGNDGNDVVLTAVVPEPATWVLLSGGIGLIVWNLRARKSSCSYGIR